MKKNKKKKVIEPRCRNCKLYDWEHKACKVIILYEGARINVPMDPNDICLYEDKFIEILPDKDGQFKAKEFSVKPEQVKMWVENPITGKRSNKGVVKIETPESFWPEIDIK